MRILALLALAAAFALPAQAEKIRVGVTPGPHAQIMEKVRDQAKATGLEIEILEFSDYVVPNEALASGDLDANSFQHQPYLDNQIADRGYKLVSVAKTVTFPLGLFSAKLKSLEALPAKAKVAIPNDPTNGGRALILLAHRGLIKLRDGAGLAATPLDITDNPKNLRIVELDAAQLPRSLNDVDIAAINGNYALEAGLDPTKDALAREAADGPYANVIAVKAADKDKPWVKSLIAAYQSAAVKQFVVDTFKGALVPAW
ncbi:MULTISPECIES: MetQ/NlpA family ABC transporter substrate-binding protein [unclassified Azospirillum]|uniref:MetQ/NlpA family ABC transporter substrate-binding protein n=1 Tax=unclassified Azospirillum TaxID=2630922 RepID=UPI000B73CB55|nr:MULTISPECIES: MetQ/NlpA family ABC transporter substrate-binding protein [unclassified Azospirillum]SNS81566.1 D-methionine transport system substrate-binding protein [Azospirillum sp. RU38E]SNS98657.1 D-methionine transport system substrate-binding protein [Azospirillum sp. RU37A]